MKKINIALILLVLLFVSNLLSGQNLTQALNYFKAQQYKKAATEFEKLIPVYKSKYGENDTNIYSIVINLTAKSYLNLGEYNKAVPLFNEFHRIYEETGDTLNILYAVSLNDLGLHYFDNGKFKDAKSNYQKALRIRKLVLGEKSLPYGQSLNNLGMLYNSTGNYKKAQNLFLQSLIIHEKHFGKKDWRYALVLNNLGSCCQNTGSFDKALMYYDQALNIYAELYGENSLDYATALNNLATLYDEMGNYQKAKKMYEKAIPVFKRKLGDQNPKYATCINNLAVLYKTLGYFTEAEDLYIESIQIQKKKHGTMHPVYATTLNNAALFYQHINNYQKAEAYFSEVIRIRKSALGKKHKDYAMALGNLAAFYFDLGNYAKAEPLYIEAIKIIKNEVGVKTPIYATYVNNLGALYKSTNRNAEAINFYAEALQLRKEILGEFHPDYGASLNNLGALYKKLGKYYEAEKLFKESLKIRQLKFGEQHQSVALMQANLGLVYAEQGRLAEAEKFYLAALKTNEQLLGEKHPQTGIDYSNLGLFYLQKNDVVNAGKYLMKNLENIDFNLDLRFMFLTETEKEQYFKKKELNYHAFYSYALQNKMVDPTFVSKTLNYTLKNKGLLLKSSIAVRKAIMESKDTSLVNSFEKWIALKKEISELYTIPVADRTKDPEKLVLKANELEKLLVKKSNILQDFNSQSNMNWKRIRDQLKPDEVAIEFVRFKNYKATWTDSIIYCALIIRPEADKPDMIRLFEEQELIAITGEFGSNKLNYINDVYGTQNISETKLYNLIWKPIEPFVTAKQTVYISPTGILHKVSFAALCLGKNVFLCDNHKIINVSSTSICANIRTNNHNKFSKALVLGGIEYDNDQTSDKIWSYLEGTKQEGNQIFSILDNYKLDVKYITGIKAKEDVFKNEVANCDIVHVATHGFFYPDPNIVKKEVEEKIEESDMLSFRGGSRGFGVDAFVKSTNPMMRSGLVLAGANNVWNKGSVTKTEDGVLTALEASQLNMSEVDLLVMSACETGLGDIKGSEGVYGLQRAFKMAGVNYMIVSLWQVPDKETQEFMTSFYKNLFETKNINQAFTITQLEMRQKYDPYYWAAFVVLN